MNEHEQQRVTMFIHSRPVPEPESYNTDAEICDGLLVPAGRRRWPLGRWVPLVVLSAVLLATTVLPALIVGKRGVVASMVMLFVLFLVFVFMWCWHWGFNDKKR